MDTNVEHIYVYEASDGWRWRAKAANGEIVASGEAHTREADARRAAFGVFPGIPVLKGAPELKEVNYMSEHEQEAPEATPEEQPAPQAPAEGDEGSTEQGTEEKGE